MTVKDAMDVLGARVLVRSGTSGPGSTQCLWFGYDE